MYVRADDDEDDEATQMYVEDCDDGATQMYNDDGATQVYVDDDFEEDNMAATQVGTVLESFTPGMFAYDVLDYSSYACCTMLFSTKTVLIAGVCASR